MRVYHEKKALRCIRNIIEMKKKLEEIEGKRLKKVDDLQGEICAIQRSMVTLVCIECHRQFNVPFSKFVSGDCSLWCPICQYESNKVRAEGIMKILDANSIKYKCNIDYKITIINPHGND